MRTRTFVVVLVVLLILATVSISAFGQTVLTRQSVSSLRLDLEAGRQALLSKDTTQRGVQILEQVIASAPRSAEAGDAAYDLATKCYRGNRVKELALYEQTWNTPSSHRKDAGKSLGHIRLAVGDRQGAVDTWLAVAAVYPAEKESCFTKAQKALIGKAREEKDWQKREAIRAQAKMLQDPILANPQSPYYWEVLIERKAMEHEEQRNKRLSDPKVSFQPLIAELEAAGSSTEAPAGVRCTMYLMATELCNMDTNHEGAILYADMALQFPDCRIPYYRSLYEKAGALSALKRPAETVVIYKQIIAEAQPSDNFANLNVRESAIQGLAMNYRALGLTNEEKSTWEQLRREYPTSRFLGEVK